MLKRLVGSTSQVLTTGGWPLARRNVARTVADEAVGFAISTYVSNSCAWPTRPSASAHRVAVVVTPKLLCASNQCSHRPGPVHRPLRHHRDVGDDRRRHRGVGKRRVLAVHVHREAAVGRHLLVAHERRAVSLEERHGQVGHRGDSGCRPGCRYRRSRRSRPRRGTSWWRPPARRPIRGRPRRAAVPKYIARSAMIGSVDVTTIEKDLPISCGMVPA